MSNAGILQIPGFNYNTNQLAMASHQHPYAVPADDERHSESFFSVGQRIVDHL